MESSKKTYEDLFAFSKDAVAFLSENGGDTKLVYAIRKLVGDKAAGKKGLLSKAFEDFEERFEDLKLEFAATDSDGFIIRNERGEYRFRKEDEKKFNRAFKVLRKETPIEIPNYVITDYDQTKEYPDSFKGFVI
jgi:hypothetical protein